MQSKGFIKLIAVLLGLACVYQRSFTFKTRGVEKQAAGTPRSSPRPAGRRPNSITLIRLQNLPVLQPGLQASSPTRSARRRELNLGLDLKGGMNVMLEVQVEDV